MRVRSVVSVLLLALVVPALVTAQSTRPPGNLRFVGDHWTPYNPPDPATFPPGANVHIIQRGDTLWSLANRYYGSPYLWPQLWEANTYITDAHWIYPGDPLLISGEVRTADQFSAEAETQFFDGEQSAFDADTGVARTSLDAVPIALATDADLYCWGYLGHPDEPLPNRIVSFEDTEVKIPERGSIRDIGVATGDIVYIDGNGDSGLVAGETYLVVEPGPLVRHPRSGATIGRHYDFRGQVRIVCFTDRHTVAVVTQACSDIRIGTRLKPMPVLPIPVASLTRMANVCTPPSCKVAGHIVNAKDYQFALGEGSLVEIDLGFDDYVEPGDFLTVYRDSPVAGDPRQILGEVAILTAEPRSATGKIIQMRYSMRVGDQVELK
jgi:hypothetical protein